MGKTLTETKLAPKVVIGLRRSITDGVATWALGVEGQTLTEADETVLRYARRDLWEYLTPQQRTTLTNIANGITAKLAELLAVEEF